MLAFVAALVGALARLAEKWRLDSLWSYADPWRVLHESEQLSDSALPLKKAVFGFAACAIANRR